jgi:hypothetical protein
MVSLTASLLWVSRGGAFCFSARIAAVVDGATRLTPPDNRGPAPRTRTCPEENLGAHQIASLIPPATRGLAVGQRLDQLGQHLVDVAHDAEVGNGEDRRLRVLVDGNDVL